MDERVFKKYMKNKEETIFRRGSFLEKKWPRFQKNKLKMASSPITMKIYKWNRGPLY